MNATRHRLTRRFLVAAMMLAVAKIGSASVLFSDGINYPDGLITNEYAYWHPTTAGVRTNPNWQMTSGSFFAKSGMGWTGYIDDVAPNIGSTNGTDSSTFRLNTRRTDFGNVAVEFDALNNGLTQTARTPAQSYDGIHVWVRYQSEYYLYAVSINRRDNTSVIKKKVAGGPSNGGTYYTLASVSHAVPYGQRQHVKVTAQDNSDGSTTIALSINGALVVQAVDKGTGGAPIRGQGAVGVRGDNCNFNFANFVVSDNAAGSPAALPTVSVSSPYSGQTVSGTFPLRATASNTQTVQWQIDGVNLGSPVPSPFTLNWYSATGVNGTHTVRALASDGAGHATLSAPVTFTLSGARAGATSSTTSTLPAVAIASPYSGQTVSGIVALKASVSNAVSVQWQVDGVNLGSPVAAPYSLNWYSSTGVNGQHTLRAVAKDAAGHTTTSAPVTIHLTGARAA